jgi:hypothetical protein
MLKLILGLLIGGLAVWLYQSKRAREQFGQQFGTGSGTFREGVAAVASATTNSAQRVAHTIDSTPLPPQAKERARAATSAVQSAADRVKQQVAGPTSDQQPGVQVSVPPVAQSPIPEDVLAEQDAATRAAAEAERDRQTGA